MPLICVIGFRCRAQLHHAIGKNAMTTVVQYLAFRDLDSMRRLSSSVMTNMFAVLLLAVTVVHSYSFGYNPIRANNDLEEPNFLRLRRTFEQGGCALLVIGVPLLFQNRCAWEQ